MIDYIASIITIIAGIFAIFGITIDPKKYFKNHKDKKVYLVSGIIILMLLVLFITIYRQSSIIVTNITLNEESLIMSTKDTKTLTATVTYSNNSVNNKVIWISSNPSIATIDTNGQIIPLKSGVTTITAQATKNNSTANANCSITVKNPPSGYKISVSQTPIDSYAYIYVTPYDEDFPKIQIYGRSPSGKIFTPNLDPNNLYHFYTESGTWTIYASLQNEVGTYEANKPEDFVTIEVTNISNDSFEDIFKQFMP